MNNNPPKQHTDRHCTNEGVKQGDPLSPFIFNAIMNPLLEQLDSMKGFKIDEANKISALAIADDLILLATTRVEARQLLNRTEAYLQELGMNLAASKSAAFEITRKQKTWFVADQDIRLKNGERIEASTAEDQLKYLWSHISPWAGLDYKGIVNALETALNRFKGVPLKPHQNLTSSLPTSVPTSFTRRC
jgi:hypothetical protein